MVVVQHLFGEADVLLDLGLLAPGERQHPVEVVAHDGGFGRHRRHLAQLLQFGLRLFARFLAELRLLDALFELVHLVAAFFAFAEFLLDRLELLVQIIFALRLLHLALHAAADLALDLQHADLGLDEGEHAFQPLDRVQRLQQLLAVGNLDGQMRGDGVGELRRIVDLRDRGQRFRRHLLVELDVALEIGLHRAHQRLDLAGVPGLIGKRLDRRLEEIGAGRERLDARTLLAFDQDAHGLVGKLEQLQHGRQRADAVKPVGVRIVVAGILLGQQENLLLLVHHLFEGAHGFLAAHEQGHDHVREYDDVAQRQHRHQLACGRRRVWRAGRTYGIRHIVLICHHLLLIPEPSTSP